MRINRLRVSQDTTMKLRHLKGRTGLTPNILCRLGLCFSLSETTVPNPAIYPEDGVEFNRYTLMGEWDSLIVGLLKERCLEDGLPLDNETLVDQLRAHLNRGVVLLYKRVKGHPDGFKCRRG